MRVVLSVLNKLGEVMECDVLEGEMGTVTSLSQLQTMFQKIEHRSATHFSITVMLWMWIINTMREKK